MYYDPRSFLSYRSIMFTNSGVYHAAIEQYFGSVCDVVEDFQSILEFVVVIVV